MRTDGIKLHEFIEFTMLTIFKLSSIKFAMKTFAHKMKKKINKITLIKLITSARLKSCRFVVSMFIMYTVIFQWLC